MHSFLYPPHLAWRLAHREHPVTVEVMEKQVEKHQRRWGLRSQADHEVRPEWDSPMSVYLKSQSSSLTHVACALGFSQADPTGQVES